MIKRLLIILFFSLLMYAQNTTGDTAVNIREIVQKQIDEARKKEAELKSAPPKEQKILSDQKIKTPQPPVTTRKTQYVNIGETDNSLLGKIIVLSSFSTLVFSILAYRRKRMKKNNSKGDLKTNVKLMREEKFIKPIDPKLKKIRTGLCLNSKYLNNNEADITNTARKYNIAKSELVLAARFRNQTVRAN